MVEVEDRESLVLIEYASSNGKLSVLLTEESVGAGDGESKEVLRESRRAKEKEEGGSG